MSLAHAFRIIEAKQKKKWWQSSTRWTEIIWIMKRREEKKITKWRHRKRNWLRRTYECTHEISEMLNFIITVCRLLLLALSPPPSQAAAVAAADLFHYGNYLIDRRMIEQNRFSKCLPRHSLLTLSVCVWASSNWLDLADCKLAVG